MIVFSYLLPPPALWPGYPNYANHFQPTVSVYDQMESCIIICHISNKKLAFNLNFNGEGLCHSSHLQNSLHQLVIFSLTITTYCKTLCFNLEIDKDANLEPAQCQWYGIAMVLDILCECRSE